ncbi:MAG: T9SS type A sorting domain-containing protein [Saprospiraceae bacterium]
MKKVKLIVLTLLITGVAFTQNSRIYVSATATGIANGQSWDDAYTELNDALSSALSGDTIWIAEGVYYPTNSLDRAVSFEPKSGVRIYGGFAAFENDLNQRDWIIHPVVLSGDIGIEGDSTDNSYNVVYLFQPDSNTVLDGLIIRDGVANNSLDASSTRSRLVCGGGLYIMADGSEAYPEIRNCRIEHNTAEYFGAGAMVNGANNGSVGPRWVNCEFNDNRALSNGGGLSKIGSSLVERGIDLSGCKFRRNISNARGGGVYYMDSNGNDQIEIYNCLFEENYAYTSGGSGFFFIGRVGQSMLNIHQSNFTENTSCQGAALTFFTNGNDFDGLIELDSNEFKSNKSIQLNPNNFYFNVIHCDLIATSGSKFLVSKSLFEDNNISLPGYIIEVNFSEATSIINKTTFINNNVDRIFQFGGLQNCEVWNSRFIGEKQKGISLVGNTVKTNYVNCIFTDPILFEFSSGSNFIDTCVFENCNFYNNPVYSNLVGGPSLKYLYLRNSFINSTPLDYLYKPNCTTYLSNCFLQGFDCSIQNPNVICEGGIITSGDPMFVDTTLGDFRLQPCSPLVNAGNNTYVTSNTDLDEQARIQGGTVDIGANESRAFTLANPPDIHPACVGSNNGAIAINPEFGCEPYTYQWEPPLATGPILSNLGPGNYSFTVTDSHGQVISDTLDVASAASLELSPIAADLLCGSTIGGLATVDIISGMPPFTYLWSNSATDSLLTMLSDGQYQVTVTDANGCKDSIEMTIEKFGQINLMVNGEPISCFGEEDALVSTAPANGKAPFSYLWSQGATDSLLNNLGVGQYTVTVTDAYGCTASYTFNITEPGLLQANAQATPTNSLQTPNGTASVIFVSGGTQNFTYNWSNGVSGQTISGLSTGTYTVTVTDAHGCTTTATTEVTFMVRLNELNDWQVSVWPNPMKEWLEIRAKNLPSGAWSFSLDDLLGRKLKVTNLDSSNAILNVSALPNGIYEWSLSIDNKVFKSGKVIK